MRTEENKRERETKVKIQKMTKSETEIEKVRKRYEIRDKEKHQTVKEQGGIDRNKQKLRKKQHQRAKSS